MKKHSAMDNNNNEILSESKEMTPESINTKEPTIKGAISFSSPEEYVSFIRTVIKDNTPPKAWLSIDMLKSILEKLQVEDYFESMGYNSLESFLEDPRYNKLWRADKQNNSPFLVRFSYGLEILEYVQTVQKTIKSIYLKNGREPVTLDELTAHLEGLDLPISYSQMGYPSFAVFIVDKRFNNQWIAKKTTDFSIRIKPYLEGKDLFLDRTYLSAEKYFSNHPRRANIGNLIAYLRRGIAGKVYADFGYKSLEELAEDETFAPIISRTGSFEPTMRVAPFFHESEDCDNPDVLEDSLVDTINRIYSLLASEDESWVSLTSIASRISSVKQRVQQLHYQSLSKFIQDKASERRWIYRYTDSIPPDFQIKWLDNPGKPEQEEVPEDFYTEEALIRDIREQVKLLGDDWVLLAVVGQYVRDLKNRIEHLGYSTLGTFVKEKAKEAGWYYTYVDQVPAKLSIKLKADFKPVREKEIEPTVSATKKSLLLEPGFCLTLRFQDEVDLPRVAALAEDENWQNSRGQYDVLRYFLVSNLVRSASQRRVVPVENDLFCYNTGLFTSNNEPILGIVKKDTPEIGPTKLTWVEAKVYDSRQDEILPQEASFYDFSNRTPIEVYICNPQKPFRTVDWEKFDTTKDPEQLNALVNQSLALLYRQVRLAVPCYDTEFEEIHLLLPLIKDGQEKPEWILEIAWRGKDYETVALLREEEAYKKARVLGKKLEVANCC